MRSPREHPTSRFVTLAVAVVLGLTGCGGGADSAADTRPTTGSSASPAGPAGSSPADGDGRLTGEGYSFELPPGWRDATEEFQEYSELIDVGAVNAEQAGEAFSDNINVLRNADQVALPPAQAEHQFAEELRTVAERVEVRRAATVDGVEALHLTGLTVAREVTAVTDQYIAYVDGAYFVVTFSFATDTPPVQRQEEIAAMLDSWTWG